MSRRKWREATLNEYVDGRLSAPRRRALEEALAQDDHLREDVAALRQTVQVLRSVPLQEPPRNYRLTPGMVSPQKRAAWRWPLPVLRWASAATALILVIGLGWMLLNGGHYAAAPLSEAPTEAANISQPTAEAQRLMTEPYAATEEAAPAFSKEAEPRAEFEAGATAPEPPSVGVMDGSAPRPTAPRATPEPTCPPWPVPSSTTPWLLWLGPPLLLLIAVGYWWAKKRA